MFCRTSKKITSWCVPQCWPFPPKHSGQPVLLPAPYISYPWNPFSRLPKKETDTDEAHKMSNVVQSRQRAVYLCAIMCELSTEWSIMSKQCTSWDYAFEDETVSLFRRTAERFQLLSTTYNRAVAQERHNQNCGRNTQNGPPQSDRLDDLDKKFRGLTT